MKKNITLQYLAGLKGLDSTVPMPSIGNAPKDQTILGRMNWYESERKTNWNEFRSIIEKAETNTDFFLDSSFLGRSEIPWDVWTALLKHRIVFTPIVWKELRDWLSNPFYNKQIRNDLVIRMENEDAQIVKFKFDELPTEVQEYADEYVKLLSCRKLVAHYIVHEMKLKGETPTEEKVLSEIQRRVRNRGLKLAIKGIEDFAKPNFLADEQLVVSSTIHGIITGNKTYLLTQDPDLLEQFYKFGYLLDTDYRAALIAEQIKINHLNFVSQPLPADLFPELTVSGPKLLFKLPRNFTETALPENNHPSVVSCIKLGGQHPNLKISRLSFCVEFEMIKGMTKREKNSPRVIACIPPIFPEFFSKNVLVAQDKLCNLLGYKFSAIDLNYVIQEIEHFKRIEVSNNPPSEDELAGLRLCLPFEGRLSFSEQPQWMEYSKDSIGFAIRHFDPSANILFDQSFLSSQISTTVDKILTGRSPSTTLKIRDWILEEDLIASKLLRKIFQKKRGGIRVFDTSVEEYYQAGYGYYLAMLGMRKLYWKYIKNRAQLDHHRDLTDEEWPQIAEHYTGIRGRKVAEAGWNHKNNESLFFNEELLTIGVLDGIFEGANVLFLTCDPVFMDQFIMMGDFIIADYLASELGHSLSNSKVISNSANLQLELSDNWRSLVLPKKPAILNFHCWLLAPAPNKEKIRVCPLVFSLERSMHRFLRVKGISSGLNINDPHGRNIRVINTPSNKEFARLSKELMISVGSDSIPKDPRLDIRLSQISSLDLEVWRSNHKEFSPVWYNSHN